MKLVSTFTLLSMIASLTGCASQRTPTLDEVRAQIENAGISYSSLSVDVDGLYVLNMHGTSVSNISTLQGLPIKRLWLDGCSNLVNIAPLKGMPLEFLNISHTKVSDISVLENMPLAQVFLHDTQVSDLRPLQGKRFSGLDLQNTPVSDLTMLRGMQLRYLNIDGTMVNNLVPLKDIPLQALDVSRTPVSDLRPIEKLKLESLYITQTRVQDLSPLAEMPLRSLRLTPATITNGIEKIRSIKSLIVIGTHDSGCCCGASAADFWKRYDAGEFNKGAKQRPEE
jgi:hypothetical protein